MRAPAAARIERSANRPIELKYELLLLFMVSVRATNIALTR
jgi:hypothetical protein